jgi:hypothetical protein
MEKVKLNAPYLSKVVYDRNGKSLIRQGKDSEIAVVIELVLNFESFNSDCSKSVLAKVKKLQKLKWKLKSARSILVKNFNVIRIIVGLALVSMVESEICDVF